MNYEITIGPGPARIRHLVPMRPIHTDAFILHGNDCLRCAPRDGVHAVCPTGAALRSAALEEAVWLGDLAPARAKK